VAPGRESALLRDTCSITSLEGTSKVNDEGIGVQSLERGTTLLIEMLGRFTATE
jgi:hypothetical protein